MPLNKPIICRCDVKALQNSAKTGLLVRITWNIKIASIITIIIAKTTIFFELLAYISNLKAN